MKKLLIALTVASLAALSQAVTLKWTYSAADTSWVTGVTSGALVYSAAGDSITDALAAVQDDMKDTSASYYVASTGGDWLVKTDPATGSAVADSAKTTGTYFIVLFGATTGKYAIAAFDAAKADGAWTEMGSGNYTGPLTNLEFQGTLVPEPTVLALLALGVAGLALRRKA